MNQRNEQPRLRGIPQRGASYRPAPQLPSLQLRDAGGRFCTDAGLYPQVFLDLPPELCQNQCLLGIFPPVSNQLVGIARLPGLFGGSGTLDVLIETRADCQAGGPLIQLRFPVAVTYVQCAGDCDADGRTDVAELVLGVGQALGLQPLGECAANDADADGSVAINELIGSVRAALDGCGD